MIVSFRNTPHLPDHPIAEIHTHNPCFALQCFKGQAQHGHRQRLLGNPEKYLLSLLKHTIILVAIMREKEFKTHNKDIGNKQLFIKFKNIVDEVFLIHFNMVILACYTEIWNVWPFTRNDSLFTSKF